MIRLYHERDLEFCRNLWRDLTQRHREIYNDPSIGGDDPGMEFDAYLKNPKLAGPWVTEMDSAVIAMAGLLIDGPQAEIEPVVVCRDRRSRGVGTQLLTFLTEEARRRGIRILSIRPVARNVEAIQCFHRAGFTTLGHLEMFLDLAPDRKEPWRRGIEVHGHKFGF
jgi:GNAT superfamily N-acetyltransferase